MEGSVIQSKWQAYSHLMRIDKPIGTLLLLWPTLWALWLAGRACRRCLSWWCLWLGSS